MTGKAILFLVLGFFVIYGRFAMSNINVVNGTYDKMISYQAQNNAYNIAVTGANVAFSNLNQTLPTPPTITMNDCNFNGGTFDVSCTLVSGSVYRLTSTGQYQANGKTYTSQVVITYQPGGWGRFAYYSESDGDFTWTGDNTIGGPFHTQSNSITVANHPQFLGEASVKGTGSGTILFENNSATDYPNFAKGFFTGVDIPMKNDSMDSTTTAGNKPQAWKITGKSLVYLTFEGTKVKYKTSATGTETTYDIASKAPNGVIWVVDGILRVKGALDGQVTLLCTGSSASTSKGVVYLDDDITLTDNPQTNKNSNDFLGIVASNNILIANNGLTDDIKIQAAMFSLYGGFGAEAYQTRGVDGTIHLYGGIVQKTRQGVGTHKGTTRTSGFEKDYQYDGRFEKKWPPFYPCGKSYRVMSWYDGVGSSYKN